MRLQPARSTEPYKELLEQTTDPRHRKLLELTIKHFKYEGTCELDKLLDTIAPNPVYTLHGGPWGYLVIEGRDGVEEMYQGLTGEAAVIETTTKYVAVADWGVVFNAHVKHQIPGKSLDGWGPVDYDYSHLGDIDPDAYYLAHIHASAFFTYEDFDGEPLLTQEIVFWHNPPESISLMDPADVVSPEESREAWLAT